MLEHVLSSSRMPDYRIDHAAASNERSSPSSARWTLMELVAGQVACTFPMRTHPNLGHFGQPAEIHPEDKERVAGLEGGVSHARFVGLLRKGWERILC